MIIPEFVTCPICRRALTASTSGAVCAGCNAEFRRDDNGVLNLLHGEGFHDDADPERSASEELMDAYTTTHYTIPALARNAHDTGRSALRVLSVGCGVGAGVDLINDAGHECYGIDCGSRVLDWSRRRNLARMYIANAKHLPFADGTFDVAFSGCVLAHIGVVGDTWETTPACAEERLQFCREIARVVRPGGSILLSGANRACPADLFHRDHGYWPRLHGPKEPFLIAFADYEHYFVEQCGCRSVTALSSEGYWGFNKLTRSAAGRLLAAVISMHMTIVSRVRPLRTSFLNPWLIVRVEK